MKANLPNARPNPILSGSSWLHYAFTFVVVGLSLAEGRAQPRGPVDRVEQPAKDLEVVAMRTRVVTDH
jgi:hypothetical protein